MEQNSSREGKIVAEYSSFRGRGSLAQVVAELQRQVDQSTDFVADTRDMEWTLTARGDLALKPSNENLRDFLPREGMPLLDQALCQVAGKAPIPVWRSEAGDKAPNSGIPVRFFRSALRKHPQRTLEFLNGVMHDESNRRLVRCLDGKVRAFLSDQYREISTLGVAKQVLQVMRTLDGKVLEASVTDTHIRIKVIATSIWDRIESVRTGGDSAGWYAGGLGSQDMLRRVAARSWDDLRPLTDRMNSQGGSATVWPSATIENSPTGHGGLNFRGGILHGVCFNLATVEQIMREVHLGQRLQSGVVYQRDTVEAEAEAIYLKMRDNLASWFNPERFSEICAQARGTLTQEVRKPTAALQALAEVDLLTDTEMGEVLAYFCGQEHQSVYGVGQAIARYAQDADADRSEYLEGLAGEVCLGKRSKAILAAAAV